MISRFNGVAMSQKKRKGPGSRHAIRPKKFTEDVLRVLGDLRKKHYIKKDLQPYLPPGHYNPRHEAQVRKE
jgi:hypothetical protein